MAASEIDGTADRRRRGRVDFRRHDSREGLDGWKWGDVLAFWPLQRAFCTRDQSAQRPVLQPRVSIPVAFELVRKPLQFCDVKTRQVKHASEVTKNELMRDIIAACLRQQHPEISLCIDG